MASHAGKGRNVLLGKTSLSYFEGATIVSRNISTPASIDKLIVVPGERNMQKRRLREFAQPFPDSRHSFQSVVLCEAIEQLVPTEIVIIFFKARSVLAPYFLILCFVNQALNPGNCHDDFVSDF